MTNESPKLISLADQTVTDLQAIANTFNSFNFSVAPEFQSKLSFLNIYQDLTKTRFSSQIVQKKK